MSGVEGYLADRMDEEIDRIGDAKKKSAAYEHYVEVVDEQAADLFSEETEGLPPLADIETNDLLITELYSKERSHRVAFFGLQLDEMRNFVQNKQKIPGYI